MQGITVTGPNLGIAFNKYFFLSLTQLCACYLYSIALLFHWLHWILWDLQLEVLEI